jgi:hypothetical protein
VTGRRLTLALGVALAFLSSRPAPAAPTALVMISHTSALLSQFSGTPVEMRAAAFVPARCARMAVRCGVLYHFPGYGEPLSRAGTSLHEYIQLSEHVPRLTMAHVYIDPTSMNGGYSYFTDSRNNGPWNSALTLEFIPYIEDLLGVGGSAQSRFLEGISSGGWTVTWLQVSNPDFFRAVWAIAPDPLDFRHFYEIDATPGSTDNFYAKPNGAPRYLNRDHGITMRRLMQNVDDDPSRGGIISSYEFAWSPRGPDGLPLRFFDRSDGSLDQQTLEAWQAYDVRTLLDGGGTPLREALAGKLNIYCGTEDTFFYNEPTAGLCDFLRQNRYAAVCRLIPGRDHGTVLLPTILYPFGLRHLVLAEAARIWRREAALTSR